VNVVTSPSHPPTKIDDVPAHAREARFNDDENFHCEF